MDTTTLDAKLRARARQKLEAAVWAATAAFWRALNDLGPVSTAQRAIDLRTDLRKKDSPDSTLDVEAVCRHLTLNVIEAAIPAWQQREVDAFLADLEKVKEQVEELGGRIE